MLLYFNTPKPYDGCRKSAVMTRRLQRSFQNERNLQGYAIFGNLSIFNLALHRDHLEPGHSAQRFGGALQALRNGLLESLWRCCGNLAYPCDCHVQSPLVTLRCIM